jgi:hypothetical protein
MSVKPKLRDQVDRPLPASLDAEKAILCSVLLDPSCLDKLDGIRPGSFHHPSHRAIFTAMKQMRQAGKPLDLVTLSQEISDHGKLADIGGAAYLAEISTFIATSQNVASYAEIVAEKAALRDYIALAGRGIEAAYQGDFPRGEIDQLAQMTSGADKPHQELFSDLGAYLDGDVQLERPTIAELWDSDHHLFYAGRLNEIHSEPGTGKTNILLTAVVAELQRDSAVLYIDPEDTPRGFTTRLRALGATTDQIRNQVTYLHNPTADEIKAAQGWAETHRPSLVILDGMAESLVAQGLDEDKSKDVLPFLRESIRPFAEAGAAVVLADHVSKNAESRGIHARGSGAKAGRYDGVSYEIVMGKPYSPEQEGFVKLKIAKDRNGGVGPRGTIAAELHFIPGINGRTIASFREPEAKPEGGFRPTAIMEKIRKHLEVYGEDSKRNLRNLGNHQAAETAIRIMVEEGDLVMKTNGRSQMFSLKKSVTK